MKKRIRKEKDTNNSRTQRGPAHRLNDDDDDNDDPDPELARLTRIHGHTLSLFVGGAGNGFSDARARRWPSCESACRAIARTAIYPPFRLERTSEWTNRTGEWFIGHEPPSLNFRRVNFRTLLMLRCGPMQNCALPNSRNNGSMEHSRCIRNSRFTD